MKLRFKLLMSMLCLIFLAGVVQAQTVDKILKQHIKKSGSKKYKKVETVIMTGNLPTPQGDFPITIYSKRPNKTKSELDIMGNQMIPSAFDGETAWMLNPMMGSTTPQKLPAETALLIAEQSQFEPLYIDYGSKGYTITLDGNDDVKGKSCYKLKIEKSSGEGSEPQYHSFDKETYMLLKVNAKGADGNRADTFFGDYKKTDFGIMMPYLWEISTQMGPQEINFIKITGNEPIDDKEFAFPGG